MALAAVGFGRSRRNGQRRLQEVEARLKPLVFDRAAVRSYPLVVAAVIGEGREPRSRLADLLIAASGHANNVDLCTRNGEDS